MYAHRLVGRQRPGRSGPDHRIDFGICRAKTTPNAFSIACRSFTSKPTSIAGGDFVFVFHLSFGQRRLAIQAPVHRLAALIQIAALIDLAECADDVGFGLVIHGQVGMIPVADHAEADEILLLALDLLPGVFAAQFAELRWRYGFAVFLFHLQFDGQAVAIPSRHIRCIETGECFRFDDDVLQHLVHRVAEVDVAVRIGRAVVQDEFRASRSRLADALVALLRLPLRQHLRLALGEVAAHRKCGVRQIQRILFLVFTHVR